MGKKSFSIRPFEKLKKNIEKTQAVSAPPPPKRKKKEEYTDEELFSREMDGVLEIEAYRLLNCARSRPHRASPAAPADPERETLLVLGEISEGKRPIPLPDTQEYVEWTNPDYHDSIIPKLHDGQFSIQDCLDLHGFTVPEAESELDLFIEESLRKGLRCIKIIHGRGLRSVKGSRVKDAVIRRLSGHFRKEIIAFVTARQCDGGLGAVYALLGKK